VADQAPPVNEPAGIEDQPAARHLNFDPSNDQLIDEGHAKHQDDADQGRPQPVAAPLGYLDADLDMTAFDAQWLVVAYPPELYNLVSP
jgi:hypothetical protein